MQAKDEEIAKLQRDAQQAHQAENEARATLARTKQQLVEANQQTKALEQQRQQQKQQPSNSSATLIGCTCQLRLCASLYFLSDGFIAPDTEAALRKEVEQLKEVIKVSKAKEEAAVAKATRVANDLAEKMEQLERQQKESCDIVCLLFLLVYLAVQ